MRVWALDEQPAPSESKSPTKSTSSPHVVDEQDLFDVVLTGVDPSQEDAAIKVVMAETDLSLGDATRLVNDHPSVVKERVTASAANALKARLGDFGAAAELRPSPGPANGLENVVISHIDPARKVAVLKILREATDLPLKKVIKIVDTHEVIECADEDEAETLKADLERAGATVELRASLDEDSEDEPMLGSSLADELERLADLHRQGLLSDAEFAAAKSKVLGA